MKIATILITCALLVLAATVPAFAADDGATGAVAAPPSVSAQEQPPAPTTDATDPGVSDQPTTDATDPAEPTPPADSGSGATGGSGATSGTGATGGAGSEPTSPTTDSTTGQTPAQPTTGNDNSSGSSDGGTKTPPKRDGTRTEGSKHNDSVSGGDSATAGAQASGDDAVLGRLTTSASAGDSGIGAGAGRAAGRATDQIERNAESGVAASLVVTRIVNEIPDWVFWALAVLGLAALAGIAMFVREHRRRRSAEEDAMVDELTGIANRKAFDRRLDLEWRRAARYGRSLGLMVMDLDGFKQVNDLNGHAAGDRVLHDIAQSLDGRMRDTDLVARIGGDEFAIICPETGVNELMTIRRQLIDHVAAGQSEQVGLSIGVAEWVPSDADALDILARADESMYRVKRGEQLAASA